MRRATSDTPSCSFCHKAEKVVGRLCSSPADASTRICDECLAVCNSILVDDAASQPHPPARPEPGHCRLCDPRIPELLDLIEYWALAESQQRHSLVYLGQARRLAFSIMGLDSA
jgi:hypothetical protein